MLRAAVILVGLGLGMGAEGAGEETAEPGVGGARALGPNVGLSAAHGERPWPAPVRCRCLLQLTVASACLARPRTVFTRGT